MSFDAIRLSIPKIFSQTDDNINGVMFGLKCAKGVVTGQPSIVFSVTKKLPASVVSSDALIPKEIEIGGVTYVTDVIEREPAVFLDCELSADGTTYINQQTVIDALSGVPQIQLPMRGGQEIIQFPAGWVTRSAPVVNVYEELYSTGTLGFFGVDGYDGNIVGVTNTHVVVEKRFRVNEVGRTQTQEILDPFNAFEPRSWVMNGQSYPPGAMLSDNGTFYIVSSRIKRYQPYTKNYTVDDYNEIDAALIQINDYPLSPNGTYAPPTPIISETSYRIWEPPNVDVPDYEYLDFATTAELDALNPSAAYETDANPRIYFTGATSGRKGFGTADECKLKIWSGNGTLIVGATVIGAVDQIPPNAGPPLTAGTTAALVEGNTFKNIFEFRHVVETPNVWPTYKGDSGSAILADFTTGRKIIGLLFAGAQANRTETIDGKSVVNRYGTGFFCRIDKVAEKLNLNPWLSTTTFKNAHVKPTVVITDYEQGQHDTITIAGKKYYQMGATTQRGYTYTPPST